MPTLEEFRSQNTRNVRLFNVFAVVVGMICGVVFAGTYPVTLFLPTLIFIVCYLPAILWRWPRLGLYLIFAAACLFEVFPNIADGKGLSDVVPFFWNVNTMFETFLGSNPKAVPLNFLEILFVILGASALIRLSNHSGLKIKAGPLVAPILIYLSFVGVGFFNGMGTGGNFNEALQEVRAQVYFFVAYWLAVNLVKEKKQAEGLFWLSAACVSVKAILYIVRRYTIFNGEIPDQGVGSHEEAFFFIGFVLQLFVLKSAEILPRLRTFMWTMLPFVLFANLCTNRRAAYAALAIGGAVLILGIYQGFPKKRPTLAFILGVLALVTPPYFFAFRKSSGQFAAPARAIQSQIEPDARDASSNLYRLAENYDLMFTMRANVGNTLLGYGYGKRFFTPAPLDVIAKEYPWYNLLPHNQIYWVWMRLGTLGFAAFWGMVAAILIYAARIVRRTDVAPLQKAVALFTLVLVTTLMIFALLDLQLSNFRDMLYVGFWIGVMSSLTPDGFKDPAPLRRGQRPSNSRRVAR